MARKKYRIKKTHRIGSPDAETDDDLLDVFVRLSNVEELLNTRNQSSIIIGRTGSGKSAILKYIKSKCENLQEIEPESMSLRFLSNSTVLKYFKSLDVNLVLFYKVLWKHVFIVELLKLYFKDDLLKRDKQKWKQMLANLTNNISNKNPRRDRALKYLEKWSNDFWQDTEYRVKSLENTLVKEYALSLGVSVEEINANISGGKSSKNVTQYEAKHKAEKVIHDSQSNDLLEIVSIMKEDLFTNPQKKYYIIIDDLDQEWIEDEFRYELIGAMVEVIKEFRQLKGVKIIISLRENLNELVFSGILNRGGQREKLKPLYSEIKWQESDLKKLLDKRLKKLSNNELEIAKAFSKSRANHRSGFEFVLDRTYYRPRDLISFINLSITNADNKSIFSDDILSKAEPLYSLERLQALEDEWGENFGKFTSVCNFLKGIENGFQISRISQDSFDEVYCDEFNDLGLQGELLKITENWRKEVISFNIYIKKILFILFRIGIIGVKKGSIFKKAFYYDKETLITRSDFSNKCKFYVHPALYSFFKVNTLEQLPEN